MKKILMVVLAVVMVLAISITAFSASVSIGDLDGNGKITASDARRTLRVSAGLDTFSAEEMVVADVDNNGKITASDARKILRVAAGLDSFAQEDEEEQLPKAIKALYDGNFRFSSESEDEFFRYEDAFGMKNGTVYAVSGALDKEVSEVYLSGYMLFEDGACYEFNIPEMIACAVDEQYIEYWGDVDYIRILGEINDKETKTSVSQENIGGVEYDVYTFSTEYGTMKFLLNNDEVKRFICYDKDYYEMINMEITMFFYEYDLDEYSPEMFTVYSFEEYLEYWSEDFFVDYYDDEYWASPIDWSSIDGTVISDEKDLPEEYSQLASDKYYLSSFGRAVAQEDDIFADSGYFYTQSEIYYDNGVVKMESDDGMGLSVLYMTDNDEIACYYVYEDGGVCTKLDETTLSALGLDYEDLLGSDISEMKLIENKAHTVTVKETELDGDKYVNISCAYEDESYITEFIFMNGVLVRIDEYISEGESIGTMFVYEFANDFDEPMTIDGYKKVSYSEFIAAFLEM